MHRDKSRLRQSRPPNLPRSLRNLGSNVSIETLPACILPKSRKKRAIKVSFPPSVFRSLLRRHRLSKSLSRQSGCLPLFFLFPSLKNDCRGGLFVAQQGVYEYRRERSCMDIGCVSEIRNLPKVVRIRSRMEEEFILLYGNFHSNRTNIDILDGCGL